MYVCMYVKMFEKPCRHGKSDFRICTHTHMHIHTCTCARESRLGVYYEVKCIHTYIYTHTYTYAYINVPVHEKVDYITR